MDNNVGGGFFRSEEKPFINRMSELLLNAETTYSPQITDFLNQREVTILDSLSGQYEGIYVHYFGGYNNSERVRAIIAPDYYQPEDDDFKIALYEIRYPERFANLSHGQILGSLTGTGIKRDKIGDIITNGKKWQFFVIDKMGEYLKEQLTKVGSFKVHIREKKFVEMILPINESHDKVINVQSLRIDTIIATVYDMSRQNAKSLVEHNRVQLNWTSNTNPSTFVGIGDTLSIRGFGRIKINDLMGKSKNNKFILFVNIIHNS
ncbi:RNA-binding protein [Companilactobacillus metriopterae]|uniref:YlmH family RNA-binding protein n=1 Tax=Companilactobacillus metriopterae TaxID=1909267 RepID=UPI00100C120A|nr:YlmH/Sll1252 family protein [Companilactobacillus metriopterae]